MSGKYNKLREEQPDTEGPYRVSIDSSGQIKNHQGEVLCTVHRRGWTNLEYNWKHDEVFIVNACNHFFSLIDKYQQLRSDLDGAQDEAEYNGDTAMSAENRIEELEVESAKLKEQLLEQGICDICKEKVVIKNVKLTERVEELEKELQKSRKWWRGKAEGYCQQLRDIGGTCPVKLYEPKWKKGE